jgi:hypothetical protein
MLAMVPKIALGKMQTVGCFVMAEHWTDSNTPIFLMPSALLGAVMAMTNLICPNCKAFFCVELTVMQIKTLTIASGLRYNQVAMLVIRSDHSNLIMLEVTLIQ